LSRVNISKFCIHSDASIRDAIVCINRGAKGIALVVDHDLRLVGTITDGDIRRVMLKDISLESPVSQLLENKDDPYYSQPITAKIDDSEENIAQLMEKYVIRQIPLLDDDERVADLIAIEDLLPNENLPIHAVVMAGGFGTRLLPLTDDLPKPMLPVGDRPLMERIIDQLQQTGIQRVNITTHYMADKIKDYFGDGKNFGVDIEYVEEDKPLGTAGALGLMKKPDKPLLVINGDILTRVDFRAMLNYHRKHKAELTVAVRQFAVDVPYGVIESNGAFVHRLREKPRYNFFVNAGIYLIEPSVHKFIPTDQHFDMTELIDGLIKDSRTVVSFPIVEYWLDIGQPIDYQQAQEDAENGRL
jgi:dTDP-glucose pyrophosphorylase/CBS domain-containing protein